MTARGESAPAAPGVWTVGHSTRTLEQLVELLRAHGIEQLVDVRTVPRSGRNPQFNREVLADELARRELRYQHAPGLGGLRKPRPDSINTGWRNAGFRGYADHMQGERFAEALGALLTLAAEGATALMCAEAVPWRCHRGLVADALTVRGSDVRHILSVRRADLHRLTPFARVEGVKLTYPGLL